MKTHKFNAYILKFPLRIILLILEFINHPLIQNQEILVLKNIFFIIIPGATISFFLSLTF